MIKAIVMVCFFLISFSSDSQEVRKVKITDVEKIITESKTPLIINFWATWCKPCIEELPYFMEEAKKYSGNSLQLLLVSVDMDEAYPEQIKKSIMKNKIIVPVYWLDETNADYFCPRIDPKWSGAIPATLFTNNNTGYRKFIEEELSHEELKKEIINVLQSH